MDNILEGSNTFGSNGVKWWIGQVADRSVWADSGLLINDVDDGRKDYFGESEVYYNRVKVRVVGYHDRLEEEDLPWAHIAATPMLSSGYGLKHHTHYLEGGESVLGFWIDGTDEQKPVITSVFYNHKNARKDQTPLLKDGSDEWIQHNEPPVELLKNGNNDGYLLASNTPIAGGTYTTANYELDPTNKRLISKNSLDNKTNLNESSQEETLSNAAKIAHELAEKTVDKPTCTGDDASFSIAGSLNEFTKLLLNIEAYGDYYVNSTTGLMVNLDAEIDMIGRKMGGILTAQTNKIRSDIFSRIEEKIEKFTNKNVKPEDKLPFSESIKDVSDSIYCLFENIMGGLVKTISNFLKTLIGKIINAPLCAAEQFLGTLLNNVMNSIKSTISPILSSLSSTLGGALGSVNSIINSALMGVGLLSKLIQCNDFKCPAPSRFDTRIGPGQGQRNNVNQLMNMVSGISDGLSGPNLPSVFATPDPDPNSIAALAGGCDSNILRCGPPIVEFFGGTPGLGGFGNAVINNIGQIIGVNILDPGMGYTKENPPYVTFRDSCGDGQGAAGTAIIDDNGSIEAVLMDYPGYNYNPTYGKVKTVSGDIEPNVVTPEGVSVTPQIDSVIVNNSGSGYNSDDTIEVDGAILQPIILGGHVVGVNVINGGFGFTSIPDIVVNSKTGVGASFQVILKFTNISEVTQKLDPTKIIQVIDCIDKPLTRNAVGV